MPALRRAFPDVVIQGKGLLATEVPMTLPQWRAPAPVPLVDEVFFEFETADGAVLRLHELEEGGEYGVIVTQAGGLLRYRMNDRVRVAGQMSRTPCLRFLGRSGRTSDIAGEKLDESQARSVLSAVLGAENHCSYLLPAERGYRCVTDHSAAAHDPVALALRLDLALCRSFQYRQARHLGQLAPVEVCYRADARAAYEAAQLARGLRWGNIKFEALVL